MNYNFHMPTQLITGEGCVVASAPLFAALGARCLLVTGASSAVRSGALGDVQTALQSQGIQWALYDRVQQNPLLTDCHEAGAIAREFGADFIVGIGGGSPLDAAKAVAIFAANELAPMDVYAGWKNPALPIVAVGTTAGTGSEVGPFAIMTTPAGRKAPLNSMQCYPTHALADPRYTWSLPWSFTVSTALDALCHAVEGYFNTTATGVSDMFAKEASRMLYRGLGTLEHAARETEVSRELREELFYASILAGVTLARCGCCFCHRLGYFLTEDYGVPHGTACAVYLPDFIQRQSRLMPERAECFFADVGCTPDELCRLVRRMTFCEEICLTREQAAEIAHRGAGSGNYLHTAPDGYLEEEARDLLERLFVRQ